MRLLIGGPRILGLRFGALLSPGDLGFGARGGRGLSAGSDAAFVYVIRGDHRLSKIGVSTNPSARIASLRTASPFPIGFSYIAAPDCTSAVAFEIERRAHDILARQRCEGEWFDVPDEVAVAAVAAAAHQLGVKIAGVPESMVDEVVRRCASSRPAGKHGNALAASVVFALACLALLLGSVGLLLSR